MVGYRRCCSRKQGEARRRVRRRLTGGAALRRGAPASFEEVEELSFETSKGVKVVNTFEGMGIRDALLRGVYAFGFEKPSAIQQRAIMPISQGGMLLVAGRVSELVTWGGLGVTRGGLVFWEGEFLEGGGRAAQGEVVGAVRRAGSIAG